DGDPFEIYLHDPGGESVIITDMGVTLMRLAYNRPSLPSSLERIVWEIASANRISLEGEALVAKVTRDDLPKHILQFVSVISKVSAVDHFRKPPEKSGFRREFQGLISKTLAEFRPHKNVRPLPTHDEYKVDFVFNHRPKPI